jgi:hypothetical protein
MNKAKTSLATNAAQAVNTVIDQAAEVESIAGKLANAYRRMARFYQKEYGITSAEADAMARTPAEDEFERVKNLPGEKIFWWDLTLLAEQNEENAIAIWEQIKEAARKELNNGHRAAEAVEWHGHSTPFQRAQFLAIRQAFIDEWQPRGGIELALIDTMAQCYRSYLCWLGNHTMHSETEVERENTYLEKTGRRKARTEAASARIEESFQMADRFNRIFLRTLRQLRDLRRYSAPVTINNPQQVNIAADGGQQVNMAEVEK